MTKSVGRFTKKQKKVLEDIKSFLRKKDYLPIIFDFHKPIDRDYTETIEFLARISRFIIADITMPRAVPIELQAIVPHLAILVLPIVEKGEKPYFMINDLYKYPWVMKMYEYENTEALLNKMENELIKRIECNIENIRKPKG